MSVPSTAAASWPKIHAIAPVDQSVLPLRHLGITFLLRRAVGQMETQLILRRQALDLRRARQACRLIETKRVRDLLPAASCDDCRQRGRILDRLRRALCHEREHRVAGIAQERRAAGRPARERRTIEQSPDEHVLHRSDDRPHVRVPVRIGGERIRDLAAVGP
jgi:hypothetical protein